MGALGNGRRGGRAPSLLFAALIACVLLLGFNYWVSNSRNVELQAKLLELQERVRQVSAEREQEQLSRSDAEEQVRRQTEQLAMLEDRNQKQQQSAQNTWKLEKSKLLFNVSSGAKTVQDMQNQVNTLLEDLKKVHKDLQSCQNNMNSLNKKLTYDMTQCNTQILATKEECKEKIEAAKQEWQKKNSLPVGAGGAAESLQKDGAPKLASESRKGNDSANSAGDPQNTDAPANLEPRDHHKTGGILDAEAKMSIKDSNGPKLSTTSNPSNQNGTLNDVANEEDVEEVMDIKGGDLKAAGALLDTAVNGEGKEDEAIEYDNEGEIEKRLSKLKDEKAAAQEFEEEMADYNGDDDNEPEFEADKQAELAEM